MSTNIINVQQPEKFVGLRKVRGFINKLTKILAIGSPLVFILAGLGSKIGIWDWKFGLLTLTQKVGPMLLIVTGVFAFLSMILAAISPTVSYTHLTLPTTPYV